MKKGIKSAGTTLIAAMVLFVPLHTALAQGGASCSGSGQSSKNKSSGHSHTHPDPAPLAQAPAVPPAPQQAARNAPPSSPSTIPRPGCLRSHLYFSPEAGRVPRVVYYLCNRRKNMANKKTRKERALSKARPKAKARKN